MIPVFFIKMNRIGIASRPSVNTDRMKTLFQNFIRCGILGWCLEITFTALHSLQKRNFRLTGNTSLWMFPIYGMGCLLAPVGRLLGKASWPVRGSIYAGLIFLGEACSGRLLDRRKLCPWDYSRARWRVGKHIRLDYFPCWAAAGLMMERLTHSVKKD